MRKTLLAALAILLLAACQPAKNYTVIISLDGFRWDYPEYYEMPFMDSLESLGVKARMQASFPASTFPNHYTMATGLVPDHNGLVNNSFWNPDTQHSYAIRDSVARFDPRYYLGEPIWATAQRQGVKCGVVYWVGSDIAVGGVYPTYYRHWDAQPHWTFEERADEIVRLMSLPEADRPQLVMGYFDEPDHQGHVHGPMSAEVKDMSEYLDSLMHSLYLRLKALPHGGRINFIVTGDHGMTDISTERHIPWYSVIPQEWTECIIGTTPTSIWAVEGYADSLYNKLSGVEHLQVWRHGEVPTYLNYGTSNRLGDILVYPELGWQFSNHPSNGLGAHGYDPTDLDMMIAFRAVGPDFKVAYDAPYAEGLEASFINIDLYPLLCKLLGVKPAPVDGRLDRIRKVLR